MTDIVPTLEAFAKQEIEILHTEAKQAAALTESAIQRAWGIGKTLVELKDQQNLDGVEWEDYCTQNIYSDYTPIWRSMRLYRQTPEKPPTRASANFKQLQIMLGDEPAPKPQPRKTDAKKFLNFKASVGCIVRWHRGGDVFNDMDNELLDEIIEDLRKVVDIHSEAVTLRNK